MTNQAQHDWQTNDLGLTTCKTCGTHMTLPQFPVACTPKQEAPKDMLEKVRELKSTLDTTPKNPVSDEEMKAAIGTFCGLANAFPAISQAFEALYKQNEELSQTIESQKSTHDALIKKAEQLTKENMVAVEALKEVVILLKEIDQAWDEATHEGDMDGFMQYGGHSKSRDAELHSPANRIKAFLRQLPDAAQ